jgi:hypothetical protein
MEAIIVADETASVHFAMRSKRVEGHPKGWNMQYIANPNHMTTKHDLDRPNASDRSRVVIGKSDMLVGKGSVGCERGVVGPHVIRGAGIGNHDGGQRGMGGSDMGG